MARTRRDILLGAVALTAPVLGKPAQTQTAQPFRFALTPVFLDNDAAIITTLRQALAIGMGQDIELV